MGLTTIRHATPDDTDALYDICLRTAASGSDGSALYADAPESIGDLYAVPYARFSPGLTFVLEQDDNVCGYVLGTDDTHAFEDWLRSEWLPLLRRKYPRGTAPAGTPSARIIERFHRGMPRTDPELVASHPAHLHINLLPQCQGRGNGRAMMTAFLAALRNRGVSGVHLGLGDRNETAFAFYQRMGFSERSRAPGSITMTRDL